MTRAPRLTRRETLLGLTAAATPAWGSAALGAAAGDARLVVVNVRGGLDGLSVVAPYGDPGLVKLRAPIMNGPVGTPGGMLDLGGFYGLHPAMPSFHAMFEAHEALVVHAVGNCANTRSHFEGQDYLQSGAGQLLDGGWLNRAVGLLPSAAGAVETGIALGTSTPLLIRGNTPVAGWAPSPFTRPSPSLVASFSRVITADPLLGSVTRSALADRASFDQALTRSGPLPPTLPNAAALGWAAGAILAAAGGPRVAVIETSSLDTHDAQISRLATGLTALDDTIQALKMSLGAAWARTVVMTITEFGRTAAVNATAGTDHGTAFAMLLAGGSIAGGRVVGTWPGLAPGRLFQGRDLQPAADVRAVAMGVLQAHLGLPGSAMSIVFPGSGAISPMGGLTRG